MENNQINSETELLAETGEMGRLSEEINQSLTETQWRQQLHAPASTTQPALQNSGQTVESTSHTGNGIGMGSRQYPPTQITNNRNRL